jgi:catechol 2,3-dioxygenase-like lactoylglutathione lyase family enzyme
MVAKLEGPQFSGGANIAIKCPSHTYEQTVAFYRDTLGLPLIEEEKDGCIFQFGPNRLWIDNVPNLSHPDIWLELETNDTEAAASFLKVHGVARRDEVEQFREDFNGFFISAPNGLDCCSGRRAACRTSIGLQPARLPLQVTLLRPGHNSFRIFTD